MISGEPWIPGYKPAFNVQASLHDAVERWMTSHILRGTVRPPPAAGLIIGDAPPPGMGLKSADRPHAERIARKFDAAARDARNRALGLAGEEIVFRRERSLLEEAGRADRARKVRWTSQEDGDGAGYDIASYSPDGRRRLIEVKTTKGWERTPFHISRNEIAAAEDLGDAWRLMRVWDFARAPKAFEIAPPLGERLALTATSFSARVI